MMNIKIFILGLSIMLIKTVHSTPVESNTIEKFYDDYVESIKNQVDKTADPCEDFSKYACGNLRKEEEMTLPERLDINNMDIKLLEEVLDINKEPTTIEEKRVHDFYLSCKDDQDPKKVMENIDVLKSIDSWPTKRDYTMKDIAKLEAEMLPTFSTDFITIEPSKDGKDLVLKHATGYTYEVDDIVDQMMKIGGASKEEAEIAASKIFEFNKKLKAIYAEAKEQKDSKEKIISVDGIENLKELIPDFDWDEFFNTLKTNINIDFHTYKFEKKVDNIDVINKAVKLIKSTDSKTVMDFLIYKYLEIFRNTKCADMIYYFRPHILNKMWSKYITSDDKSNQLQMLDNFEKSLEEVKKHFKNPDTNVLLEFIGEMREVLNNHEEFMSEKELTQFYGAVKTDPKNVYKNIINLNHYIVSSALPMLKNIENGKPKLSGFHKTIFGVYDHSIEFRGHGKPLLYYYVTRNNFLWSRFFGRNEQHENTTIVETCLAQQNENRTEYINSEFLKEYAANRINFLDYLKVIKIHSGKGIIGDMLRLYFTALAQEKCFEGETTMEDTTFRVLRNMEEFSRTFGCPPNTAMSKYDDNDCMIEGCTTQTSTFDILPYKLPSCQHVIMRFVDLNFRARFG